MDFKTEKFDRVELLKGWSAQSRLHHSLFALASMPLFLLGVCVALFGFSGSDRVVVMYPLVGMILVGGWGLIAAFGLPTRLEEEERAGYTISRFGREHLPMVDQKTGRVLRKVGEPPLDRRETRQRRREARRAA